MHLSRPRRLRHLIIFVIVAGSVLVGFRLGGTTSIVQRSTSAALAPLARLAGQVIVREDELAPADYLLVLNGAVGPRVEKAVELYRSGLAPEVVIAQAAEVVPARRNPPRPRRHLHDLFAEELQASGVPPSAIGFLPFPDGVLNTRDEAQALRAFLSRKPAGRVIVVTSDYHTGRAHLIFRQELRGIDVDLRMAGAPSSPGAAPDGWWRSENGRRIYGKESLKLACALVRCR